MLSYPLFLLRLSEALIVVLIVIRLALREAPRSATRRRGTDAQRDLRLDLLPDLLGGIALVRAVVADRPGTVRLVLVHHPVAAEAILIDAEALGLLHVPIDEKPHPLQGHARSVAAIQKLLYGMDLIHGDDPPCRTIAAASDRIFYYSQDKILTESERIFSFRNAEWREAMPKHR